MHARLILMKLGPGMRETAEQLAARQAAALKQEKGYVASTWLGNDDEGKYGSLVLWDTSEDADAAFAKLFPPMQEQIEGLIKAPPINELYEVFELPT